MLRQSPTCFGLGDSLETDAVSVRKLAVRHIETAADRAYSALIAFAPSPRQERLRRRQQSIGATVALVPMRRGLLGLVAAHPALRRKKLDLAHLVRSWFNRGFLVLRQISWDTPTSIPAKIFGDGAVQAINDWNDFRRRLYPSDRRGFACLRPAMPRAPVIFVEVALSKPISDAIQYELGQDRAWRDGSETRVAVFCSISNCRRGLKRMSYGNLLKNRSWLS
ncbi:MAG: hypothetical protein HKN63_07555 [Rhodobacteraceae bacterium]|nr:hypothetical protein [Paracoccaceae bacterium]